MTTTANSIKADTSKAGLLARLDERLLTLEGERLAGAVTIREYNETRRILIGQVIAIEALPD